MPAPDLLGNDLLGNDVVDLRDPEARPVDPARFDARVFHDAELADLDACGDRESRRWRLWAAKEAAYKALVRRDPATVFSPARFRFDPRGFVETPAGRLPVRLCEQDGAVHAVVDGGGDGSAREEATRVAGMTRVLLPEADAQAPGREVRRFACREIARALGVDASRLEIGRRGRVPELRLDGRATGLLSLSHHGGVLGFAFASAEELSERRCS